MKQCLECNATFDSNMEIVFHTCENVTDVCEHGDTCPTTSDHYARLQWEEAAIDSYLERVREERQGDKS